MSRIRSVVVGVLLGGPFYLLLIDTTSTPELIAGACATTLAAGIYELAYAEGFGHASFRSGWLRRAWQVFAHVPSQVVIVSMEVVAQTRAPRPQRGCLRAVEFHAGDEKNPRDLGRRALAEGLGSLTPNTIVIGVDPDANLLLVHQLRTAGGDEQLDPLGLGTIATG